MKKSRIFLLALLLIGNVSILHAGEVTMQVLMNLGWNCDPAGDKVACTAPKEPRLLDVFNGKKQPESILVMIFDAAGTTFIGSENHIRADLYAGQACPKAGKLEPYEFELLGPGYFSCHHFEKEIDL